MNKIKSFSWASLLLIVLTTGSYGAQSEKAATSQGMLVYSLKSSSHSSSFLLKSPNGTTYRLSLIPELDVRNHVVVLDLVLQRMNKGKDDPNLLDVTGKLHGYQPYFFAASDFVHGARNSAYGDLRVIDLPQLGMEMRVKVDEVNVEPTSEDPSQAQGYGYQFDNLNLQIAAERLGGGTSK